MDTLHARKLTRSEKDFLLRQLDEKSNMAYSARIILLSRQGYTAGEIGVRLNIYVKIVRKWIRRFSAKGIRGIIERPKTGENPNSAKSWKGVQWRSLAGNWRTSVCPS